jgi:hypothetical protein
MIVVMAMIRAKGEQRRSGFVDLDFDGGCGCPILLSLQLNKYFSTPFGTVRRSDSASFVDLTQFNDYRPTPGNGTTGEMGQHPNLNIQHLPRSHSITSDLF